MPDEVTRAEVDSILDSHDLGSAEALLAAALMRPVRDMGPRGPVAPDQDVEHHVRARGASERDLRRMAFLSSRLSSDASGTVLRGNAMTPDAAEMLARLGYLSVALGLHVDAGPFEAAAIAMRSGDVQPERDAEVRLFGILRAFAKLGAGSGRDASEFWRSWLDHPRSGIRTIAAQSLARSAPGDQLASVMGEVTALDVQLGMVCFDWIRRPDVARDVAGAAARLSPATRARVVAGLRDVGKDAAAVVVQGVLAGDPVASG